jgi:hypothetical protein
MSNILDTFQKRHQEKLEQLKRGPVDEAFLDGIALLLGDLRQAGALVADSAERGQLRALARFWGNVAYDHRGVYPDTTLQPLDISRVRPQDAPARRPLPPLNWILAGGAAVIVIAAGLATVGWLAQRSAFVEATPAPTAASIMSHVVVGTQAADGTLTPADTFCAGTPEIAARFALDDVQAEALWRWEVQRDGTTVISQTATLWKREDARRIVPILTGEATGVEPGQYNLLVYVGEQTAEAHPFRVLATPSRISNLQVSDVPAPTSGVTEIAAGVRVLYLTYEYEGMCPGLKVVHTLYRDGQPLQESVETWSGAPQGQSQVSFQAAADQPFPPGDYEATVTVTGAEAVRAPLVIQEQVATRTPPSTFGAITMALGVQPDGAPIITAPDNVFDWNTKVVYAIFDYTGMSDGTSWAAVWRRDGQEVARQEEFWNVESAGTRGTRWVAYYNENGQVLPGGAYSVTLTVGNVVQRSADFQILFYVPPEQGGGQ